MSKSDNLENEFINFFPHESLRNFIPKKNPIQNNVQPYKQTFIPRISVQNNLPKPRISVQNNLPKPRISAQNKLFKFSLQMK